ncbi:PhoH family protein [Draconibacterium sp. IB214405]|uniref:PhoH family protein n=1 Tax=Draconibacterium sp. IB214405 TaxID=3097352 RepID=UPI002A115197|nr:PhoH family protein [Draconibacterium sp. IB214405]MDX8339079.1 PhoH family protein [Draconibacterium sp. IB214405]
MDKQILLEGIDLLEFFGVNNSKIELIKRLFPKIKITARGHALFVQGEPKEIKAFEKKFALILDHYYQYNSLTEEIIHELLNSGISSFEENGNNEPDIIVFGNSGKPVRARTPNQRRLVESNGKNDLIFAIGPAGTGKTYTAIALAVRALKNKEIRKIILSRPAVEAGENLGFLPGDLKDKIDPYLQPLYDALQDMIPPKKLEEFMKDGTIQIAPLAFMRGRTLSNAYVILDEAQNTTVNQLKMFLTRMGLNAKFIITGDVTQIDLPRKSNSGLIQALRILKGIKNISTIYFDKKDIVRHKLVRDIVEAYDKHAEEKLEIKTDPKESRDQ